MATGCGIHVDERTWRLVVLEGGLKKHRITARASGEIPPGPDPVTALAEALRAAAKQHRLRVENVGLVVESGQAAFRTLTLPFDERAKIEAVLRFEIENELPQWSIDDVVVDYLVTQSKPGVQSDLLVTAIPKDRLRRHLQACELGGLEATEAELDGSALFNAAHEAGRLDASAAQILVHVGDASTTVVLADGGRLHSMRAIRAGAFPPAPVPGTGDAAEDAGSDEAASSTATAGSAVDPEKRLAETVQRIRRELLRTLSGAQTVNPIGAVYLAGHELPGLTDATLLDVPVERLDAVPNEGASADVQAYVIAYGAALRQLGDVPLQAHLRREDLRFTGTFERLELPLAVFSLLLFTLLAVRLIVINKQLLWRDEGDLAVAQGEGDLQIWLEASNGFMFPNPEDLYSGRLKNPPEAIRKYARDAEQGLDEQRTKFEELREIERLLKIEIDKLRKDLGEVSEIIQPQSALRGATLVMSTIDALGEQVGRVGVRDLAADYVHSSGGKEDHVQVKLTLDFLAADDVVATKHYSALMNALESAYWCKELERKATKVLEVGGVYVEGLSILVDVAKTEPPQEPKS
jgi:hypothetical protein